MPRLNSMGGIDPDTKIELSLTIGDVSFSLNAETDMAPHLINILRNKILPNMRVVKDSSTPEA